MAASSGVGRHEIGHPRLDLCNPAIEHGEDAANVGARYWVGGLLEAGGFLLTHLDKLAPAGRLRLERAAQRSSSQSRCRTTIFFGRQPPIGWAARLPVSWNRRTQSIVVLMPIPKRSAACRCDRPSRSTARTTRSRRSIE